MNSFTFLRRIYRDNAIRVVRRRNLLVDLSRVMKNATLRPIEVVLLKLYQCDAPPPIFVVGVPRSGTTLLTQLIVDHFDVGYISNAVSTYWRCPLMGLMWNPLAKAGNHEYDSFLGQTEGKNAPNEFGYFWQWWMKHDTHDDLDEEHLDRIRWEKIRAEITALSCYLERPLVFKNLVYFNYKISRIASEFPRSKFIYVTRDPVFTVQSILEARRKRYGTVNEWWSIRPANVHLLKNLEPEEQVAAQYADVSRAISRALDQLDKSRWLTVRYEDIGNVSDILSQLSALFGLGASPVLRPVNLKNRNVVRLSNEELLRVEAALKVEPK